MHVKRLSSHGREHARSRQRRVFCPPVAALVATLFFAGGSLRAEPASQEQERAKEGLVAQLYQATDGARVMCREAPPDVAKDVEDAVAAFTAHHERLVTLMRQSVYYAPVRAYYDEDHFRLFGNTPEEITGNCKALAWLVRGVDGDEATWREAGAILAR